MILVPGFVLSFHILIGGSTPRYAGQNYVIGQSGARDPLLGKVPAENESKSALIYGTEASMLEGNEPSRFKTEGNGFINPIDSLLKAVSMVVRELDFDTYFQENTVVNQGKDNITNLFTTTTIQMCNCKHKNKK